MYELKNKLKEFPKNVSENKRVKRETIIENAE